MGLLSVFMKAFNRNEDMEYHVGKRIFDRETYEKLIKVRKEENQIEDNGFFLCTVSERWKTSYRGEYMNYIEKWES